MPLLRCPRRSSVDGGSTPVCTACPKADQQMGMKKLLLEKMLLTFEFHNTVSGAIAMGIVPVYVGLDYHSETFGCA